MAKITIFGLAGTGKTSTGKLLAEKLKYEFQSTGNMFRAVARDLGLSLQELEMLSKKDDKYDKELDNKVVEFGKTHDNFIFESRLAWYFIPDSFKIHLICDYNERIKRVANREGKDFELVKDETENREQAIFERYNNYYGIVNVSDSKNFDLEIDTTFNNLEEVLEIIMTDIKNRKII